MASDKTCPHDASEHVKVSGTKLRKALSEDLEVPVTLAALRCEILREYYAGIAKEERARLS